MHSFRNEMKQWNERKHHNVTTYTHNAVYIILYGCRNIIFIMKMNFVLSDDENEWISFQIAFNTFSHFWVFQTVPPPPLPFLFPRSLLASVALLQSIFMHFPFFIGSIFSVRIRLLHHLLWICMIFFGEIFLNEWVKGIRTFSFYVYEKQLVFSAITNWGFK